MTSICAGMWLGQLSMGPGVPLTQVLTPRLMKVFFSQSQLSVCAVLSAALACCTSVCTLKIPSTGSHTIVWAHKNTVHTGRDGVWAHKNTVHTGRNGVWAHKNTVHTGRNVVWAHKNTVHW